MTDSDKNTLEPSHGKLDELELKFRLCQLLLGTNWVV